MLIMVWIDLWKAETLLVVILRHLIVPTESTRVVLICLTQTVYYLLGCHTRHKPVVVE